MEQERCEMIDDEPSPKEKSAKSIKKEDPSPIRIAENKVIIPSEADIQGKSEKDKDRKTEIQKAIIGLIGIVIGAVLTAFLPLFAQKLVTQSVATQTPVFLTIEQISYSISTYDGERDTDKGCCAGRAEWEYTQSIAKSPEYLLRYSFSDNTSEYNYAGIVFVFEQSQNLNDYKNIEFTIDFGKTLNQVKLSIEDIAQEQENLVTGNPGEAKKFVVPLSNFGKIDFKAIHAISFQVDSDFMRGRDDFVVKDIRFTK
jgi:hypothetical protein